MEIFLNRWRGTGIIFSRITGTMIYASYMALIVGLLSLNIFYGLAMIGLFIIGESMGWGKWVGSLCYPTEHPVEQRYEDKEGYDFPYIHQTANIIVKEREDYLTYCNIALGIRGLYWWLPLMLFMAVIGITSYWLAILGSVLLGIGFPLACYIARITKFEFTWWKISCIGAWERQEIVYGLIQGIVLWAVVLLG